MINQESEKRLFGKSRLPGDEAGEGQVCRWDCLSLIVWVIVGIGLLSCILMFACMVSKESADKETPHGYGTIKQPEEERKSKTPSSSENSGGAPRTSPRQAARQDYRSRKVDDFVKPGFPERDKIDYSKEQDEWFDETSEKSESSNLRYYGSYFLKIGVEPGQDSELALKILAYEKELEHIVSEALDLRDWEIIPIFKLGEYTTPYVTQGEWVTLISKYTNHTYTGLDRIEHGVHSTSIIKKLFRRESVGKVGLQYLVAWSIFRQLVNFTDPYAFRGERTAEDACYELIRNLMNIAINGHHFQSVIPPRMVYQTKRMVSRIRNAFENTLSSSSWITSNIREHAINKLINLTVYVGSPGRQLDPEFVEEIYRMITDVSANRLFPSHNESSVIVYLYGPIGLNYGALGTMIGHELMHAFDVKKVQSATWRTDAFQEEYTKRALCLRRSHKSVLSLSRQEETWDDEVDSENLCDLVGTMIAYAAFASLPQKYLSVQLVGLNLTSEQLFFINHCVAYCANDSELAERYAPYRSRCIVPLMNMPEFSTAFNCGARTRMNPRQKCTFWSPALFLERPGPLCRNMVDSAEGRKCRWIIIFLTGLIILLLGLLCCTLLLVYMVTEQSPVKDDITQVDTLAALHVPRAQAPLVTRPTEEPLPLARNISATTPPEPRHLVPSSYLEGDKCVGPLCSYVANTLRSQFNFNVHPCNDFYQYVCGKYRGSSSLTDGENSINVGEHASLASVEAPPFSQTAIQKAAAMYKACVSFASSYLPETIELVKWMIAMNLDFVNTTRLKSVDPVEIMVRGSLDLGVEAIISIRLDDRKFRSGKRAIEVRQRILTVQRMR
ncbi:hypothetical protein MTO96_032204 [Rhipicephalus appendiculatus]